MVKYNPTDKRHKSVVGAVHENEVFTLSVECAGASRVFFCFWADGGKQVYKRFMRRTEGDTYSVSMSIALRGLYFYLFEAETDFGVRYICRGDGLNGVLSDGDGLPYQLTVYGGNADTAAWFKGGVAYHVFIDRFFKGGEHGYPKGAVVNGDIFAVPDHRPVDGKVLNNEFFGGDLDGIRLKLPYIASLGVTVIYLSPFCESNSNHKYNVGDFLSVDGGFGGERALEALIAEAAEYGIKIIMDGVYSHTGDDSVYFNKYGSYDSVGACQSKDSPYYGWYTFTRYPDRYKTWWGIDTLPEVNKLNASYRDFICGEVLPEWLGKGVAGVRLDVVDELPDEFLYPLCAAVRENGDNIVIGEVWENATDKIAYGRRRKYFQGGQLDSVMNYPLKDAVISLMRDGDGRKFVNLLLTQIDAYPKACLDKLFNMLSSHDTKRAVTAISGDDVKGKDAQAAYRMEGERLETAVKKFMAASVLQYTLYGVPCLYYGDEAGLQGFGDPFCRACYPWGRENGELVKFFARLGALRRDELFKDALTENIAFKGGVLSFDRIKGGRGVNVAVNVGADNAEITLKGRVVLGKMPADGEKSARLAPYEFIIAAF